MEKTYDVDYFIEKFEAIPEKMWHSGKFVDPSILAALRYIKSKQYPELSSPPVTAEQVIEELEGVTV